MYGWERSSFKFAAEGGRVAEAARFLHEISIESGNADPFICETVIYTGRVKSIEIKEHTTALLIGNYKQWLSDESLFIKGHSKGGVPHSLFHILVNRFLLDAVLLEYSAELDLYRKVIWHRGVRHDMKENFWSKLAAEDEQMAEPHLTEFEYLCKSGDIESARNIIATLENTDRCEHLVAMREMYRKLQKR